MATTDATSGTDRAEYTAVARRYRPQQFADLIGQEHVARALVNALKSGRVAHAYLFTGARGVGKTSAARILAKALNCVEGPTATPCDRCNSCLAIAGGEDLDTMEIDGASNNKVEEIRELRSGIQKRTHGRYRIYIIDEVHMLTTQAFNALLKTLEEPPAHVKFIFATTEVQKIPITILSRCQRFDFAHVGPTRIFDQLKSIVGREGHKADDDALRLVARKANGSMRDSQSLLDQLLAASPERLTAETVHAVLGTAGDERVAEVAAAILNRDPLAALAKVGEAAERGLQLGDFTDQLIEYWRALMLAGCGGPGVEDLPVTPSQRERVLEGAKRASLDTILSGLDVLTATKARMRGSAHLQVLLEMAVVRLARLEDMLSVGQLIRATAGGGPLPAPASPASRPSAIPIPAPDSVGAKKNGPMAGQVQSSSPAPAGHSGLPPDAPIQALELSAESMEEVWRRIIRHFEEQSPVLAKYLRLANLPAIFGPNALAIRFPASYNDAYVFCAAASRVEKLQEVLKKTTGRPVTVRLERVADASATTAVAAPAAVTAADHKNGLMSLPMFKRAGEVLGAQMWKADEDFDPTVPPPAPTESEPDSDEVQ